MSRLRATARNVTVAEPLVDTSVQSQFRRKEGSRQGAGLRESLLDAGPSGSPLDRRMSGASILRDFAEQILHVYELKQPSPQTAERQAVALAEDLKEQVENPRGPIEPVWKLGLAGWKSKGIMIRSRILVFRSSPSRRSGSLPN